MFNRTPAHEIPDSPHQSQATRSLPGSLLADSAKDDSRDAEVLADALRTDRRCFRRLARSTRCWSSCANGRVWQRNCGPSATGWATAPANSSGATIRNFWTSPTMSQPAGPSTCGRSSPRPRRRGGCARRPSPACASATASVAEGARSAASPRHPGRAGQDRGRRRPCPSPRQVARPGQPPNCRSRDQARPPDRTHGAGASRCGVAPVTKRSGKFRIVQRRQAAHQRLANAVYHWSRVARTARPQKPRQVRRAPPAWSRSRPSPPLRRRPPHRLCMRHARNRNHIQSGYRS